MTARERSWCHGGGHGHQHGGTENGRWKWVTAIRTKVVLVRCELMANEDQVENKDWHEESWYAAKRRKKKLNERLGRACPLQEKCGTPVNLSWLCGLKLTVRRAVICTTLLFGVRSCERFGESRLLIPGTQRAKDSNYRKCHFENIWKSKQRKIHELNTVSGRTLVKFRVQESLKSLYLQEDKDEDFVKA